MIEFAVYTLIHISYPPSSQRRRRVVLTCLRWRTLSVTLTSPSLLSSTSRWPSPETLTRSSPSEQVREGTGLWDISNSCTHRSSSYRRLVLSKTHLACWAKFGNILDLTKSRFNLNNLHKLSEKMPIANVLTLRLVNSHLSKYLWPRLLKGLT